MLRRRDVLLAGAAAIAGAVMPRAAHAGVAPSFHTNGLLPGSDAAQTAALQSALNEAARTGTPLFLPPGTYKTGCLSIEAQTEVRGVPGRTVLRAEPDEGGLFAVRGAGSVHLSGLVLDGANAGLGTQDALLTAIGTTDLTVHRCRILNSRKDGVLLSTSSGRITYCHFGRVAGTAVSTENASHIEIGHNVVDVAALGISVAASKNSEHDAVVHGNHIRHLLTRKIGACGGIGIGVDADCRVTANMIEGAPAYGILVGARHPVRAVDIAGNVIRGSHIGIGVSEDRLSGRARIAENLIDGTNEGGIRAMTGPRPVGPDLAGGHDVARGLIVHANVSR